MSGKENRFERMLNGGPPMLRCWVNRHSGAILLPGEAHVIIEDFEGRPNYNIVPERKIVLLGNSSRSDAISFFKDAYVEVGIVSELPDESGYIIEVNGLDAIRARVAKEQIIFAQPHDPIWEAMKVAHEWPLDYQSTRTLDGSGEGNLVIDLTDGSWKRMDKKE